MIGWAFGLAVEKVWGHEPGSLALSHLCERASDELCMLCFVGTRCCRTVRIGNSPTPLPIPASEPPLPVQATATSHHIPAPGRPPVANIPHTILREHGTPICRIPSHRIPTTLFSPTSGPPPSSRRPPPLRSADLFPFFPCVLASRTRRLRYDISVTCSTDSSAASECRVGRTVCVAGERDSRARDGDGALIGGQEGAWVRAELEAWDAVPD